MSSAPPLSESVGPPLRFLFLEFHLFLFNIFLPYKSNYLLTIELYQTEGEVTPVCPEDGLALQS